jgi:hypothetical protein
LRVQAEAFFGGERSRDAVHVEDQSVGEDEGIELVRVSAHALRSGQRARRFRTSGPRRAEANPARVTFSLDDFLARAGWARVDDERALAAGDVVFTTGAPDHVMLFHGWADQRARIALVSDNQRRRYRRPLAPPPGSDVAGFGFARRAPAAAPAPPRAAGHDRADDPPRPRA